MEIRAAGIVDRRPYAVGSIAHALEKYPTIDCARPAIGYSDRQLRDLATKIERVPSDVVVVGIPIDRWRIRRPPANRKCVTWLEPVGVVTSPMYKSCQEDGVTLLANHRVQESGERLYR